MNWLAHLYLSEPTPEFRLGNLLPDFNRAEELKHLSPAIVRGMEQHLRIDAFTDSHPIVRRSVARINPPYRRYGGILVDLFYDHFLSTSWEKLSTTPLTSFIDDALISFEPHYPSLPAITVGRLCQMRSENWLGSYSTIEGTRLALTRVSRRFTRPTDLAPAISQLEENYAELRRDFAEFFPLLRSHLELR